MALSEITPPPSLGTKFQSDGSPIPFGGNTIICHLDTGSELYARAVKIQEDFVASELGDCFALLPPSSFHMTVFEGICDQIRNRPGHWPLGIDGDASRSDVTSHFMERLDGFPSPSGFRMQCLKLDAHWPHGIYYRLQPADEIEGNKLKDYRDALSHRLGLRQADHDEYPFHTTLCYWIGWMTPKQQSDFAKLLARESEKARNTEVSLGRPEFCEFDDLTHFRRLRHL